jgi:uncharacterized protein (DUF1778 family)
MKRNLQHQTRRAVPSHEFVTVRMTSAEKREIERAAKAKSLTISQFIRQIAQAEPQQ